MVDTNENDIQTLIENLQCNKARAKELIDEYGNAQTVLQLVFDNIISTEGTGGLSENNMENFDENEWDENAFMEIQEDLAEKEREKEKKQKEEEEKQRKIKEAEEKKDLKVPEKRPEIKIKPYTKLNTSIAELTKWIEVPIRELVDFSRFEINYEKTKPNEIVCPICRMDYYEGMLEMSDKEIDDLNEKMIHQVIPIAVVLFSHCKNHFYHKTCADSMMGKSEFIKCAVCCMIYGVMKGDMPNGTMTLRRYSKSQMHCPGFESCGTIEINYNIPSGTRNGSAYYGTGRVAYLPDCKEGNEVLKLLQKAFDRKLTFTVGTSVTTGAQNCVVWNGIHHKTQLGGGATWYGYPDPTYLSRVKQELAAKGVLSD